MRDKRKRNGKEHERRPHARAVANDWKRKRLTEKERRMIRMRRKMEEEEEWSGRESERGR